MELGSWFIQLNATLNRTLDPFLEDIYGFLLGNINISYGSRLPHSYLNELYYSDLSRKPTSQYSNLGHFNLIIYLNKQV